MTIVWMKHSFSLPLLTFLQNRSSFIFFNIGTCFGGVCEYVPYKHYSYICICLFPFVPSILSNNHNFAFWLVVLHCFKYLVQMHVEDRNDCTLFCMQLVHYYFHQFHQWFGSGRLLIITVSCMQLSNFPNWDTQRKSRSQQYKLAKVGKII